MQTIWSMFQSNLRHDHWLRSGGPDLKKTQVYPKAFGLRIRQLHEQHMDCRVTMLFWTGGQS